MAGCCDKREERKPKQQQKHKQQQQKKLPGQQEPKPTGPACPEDAYSLDACVVQASRYDMCVTENGAAAVERVWIMSRPPKMRRGVSPTVSARRASVTLDSVQGRAIMPGEVMCKKVCTDDGGGGGGGGSDTRNTDRGKKQGSSSSSCPRGRSCN